MKDFDKDYGFLSGNFKCLMDGFGLTEYEASETQHAIAHLTGDLRQEAIKWIKDLEEHKEKLHTEETDMYFMDSDEEIIGADRFIRTFFNITEEELK